MTVADALEWCIHREGIERVFHYLDDFIIFAPPVSDQCQIDLNALKRFYFWLGTPLAAHKREGATMKLKFLEIEIDTVRGTMKLPVDKLERLISTLAEWGDRKVCTRREFESLVGLLNQVVYSSHLFSRKMINLLVATGCSCSSIMSD